MRDRFPLQFDPAWESKWLKDEWALSERWKGIVREYTAEDVVRHRGFVRDEFKTEAARAETLWRMLRDEPFVRTWGPLSGFMALQMAKAGIGAFYVSGWQVAAAHNLAREMYPDQSLYPATSVP